MEDLNKKNNVSRPLLHRQVSFSTDTVSEATGTIFKKDSSELLQYAGMRRAHSVNNKRPLYKNTESPSFNYKYTIEDERLNSDNSDDSTSYSSHGRPWTPDSLSPQNLPEQTSGFTWAFFNCPATMKIAGLLLLAGGLFTLTIGAIAASASVAAAGTAIAGIGALLRIYGSFNKSEARNVPDIPSEPGLNSPIGLSLELP